MPDSQNSSTKPFNISAHSHIYSWFYQRAWSVNYRHFPLKLMHHFFMPSSSVMIQFLFSNNLLVFSFIIGIPCIFHLSPNLCNIFFFFRFLSLVYDGKLGFMNLDQYLRTLRLNKRQKYKNLRNGVS